MKFADLIYGTFPDLPGSQQVVHKSEIIDADLLAWLINSYDQFGDCRSEDYKSAITVMWYRRNDELPLACITKVTQQDKDFSGRWGALLRHTAILSQDEYDRHAYIPLLLASRLVERGTSNELREQPDFNLEIAEPLRSSEIIVGASVGIYRDNLEKLLRGERLVLYADSATDYLESYLNTLVALLPLAARQLLSWSQFTFRSWEKIGLSVVYNSRYEAATEGAPSFATEGESSLRQLQLTAEEIAEYLNRLTAAFESENHPELSELLDTDDWRITADDAEDADQGSDLVAEQVTDKAKSDEQ